MISSGERYSADQSAVSDYRLSMGDKVRVTVFREPDMSGDFSIGPNGTLPLPLIGEVQAQGRHVEDVAKDAQEQYGAGYIRNPQVNMEVITYRPFFILGEVTAPGQFPYSVGLTAMNAIATAQGFTPRADRYVVHIRREGTTAEEVYQLTPDLRIYPGDTIRIGERFF